MEIANTCLGVAYEDAYKNYIVDTGGNVWAARKQYKPDCLQEVDGSLTILYKKQEYPMFGGLYSFNGYSAVPLCFGLLDTFAVEATGASRLRRRPGFSLDGTGVLIGFVDTGIDIYNPLFQNADGTTRIECVWDQTDDSGKMPTGFYYGTEYDRKTIDRNLQDNNQELNLEGDPQYHGSFMAGIACGGEDVANSFTGMAPRASIMAVKLKQTKNYLRQFYGINENVECFQEDDIMLAIRYLWQKSQVLKKPLVVYLGVGTNGGSHTGLFPLGTQMSRLSTVSGICIVGGAGNETNQGHHYEGEIGPKEEKVVELQVDGDSDMTVELWTDTVGIISVGVEAPDGEFSGLVQIRNYEQKIEFVFYPTKIYVYYQRIENYSGTEVVVLRMKNLTDGLWKIHVKNLGNESSNVQIWLPMRNFISEGSRFLDSSPNTLVCNPGNNPAMITSAAYNYINDSIYTMSSRGFSANYAIKPDFAAPGVDIYGPISTNSFGSRSGTSVAAAFTAGAVALLFQWGIVLGNNKGMNTITAKNFLIRGAKRVGMVTPNRSFGWGILDIYETFMALRLE